MTAPLARSIERGKNLLTGCPCGSIYPLFSHTKTCFDRCASPLVPSSKYPDAAPPLRIQQRGLRFALVSLLYLPALFGSASRIINSINFGKEVSDDSVESLQPLSTSESPGPDADLPQRLPRLIGPDNYSIVEPSWLPLKAAAWLLPNANEPSPTLYHLAAMSPSLNPYDYTILPLPLITGAVKGVRLTARELMIKGLILETSYEDKYKAICLAVGLERLETKHFNEGHQEPPVLPYEWDITQKVLLNKAGARCAMKRFLKKVAQSNCCIPADTEDMEATAWRTRLRLEEERYRKPSRETDQRNGKTQIRER